MFITARAVVCLSLWLSVCQAKSTHIPPKMNRTIQDLLKNYTIPLKERLNGTPVFPREPLTGKMEAKRVFMGAILETYEKLIGHMLKQLPPSSPQTAETRELPATGTASNAEAGPGNVREGLNYLLKTVQGLKHRYQEQEKLLKGLQGLRHIQMDNIVVQSKALWELPWLFEEASSLVDTKMQRRRRRQAWKVKTHLRP